jgi:hypothetical protein
MDVCERNSSFKEFGKTFEKHTFQISFSPSLPPFLPPFLPLSLPSFFLFFSLPVTVLEKYIKTNLTVYST